jgi:hypothetical protein
MDVVVTESTYRPNQPKYRDADKPLARPTSPRILFDGENISFDDSQNFMSVWLAFPRSGKGLISTPAHVARCMYVRGTYQTPLPLPVCCTIVDYIICHAGRK